MTVQNYVERMGATGPILAAADVWSNAAASGYAIKAMQDAGLNRETIGRIVNAMEQQFDTMDVDDAARVYYNF